MPSNILDVLNSLSISVIIEGIIIGLAVIAISAIFGVFYIFTKKLFAPANKLKKLAVKIARKYIAEIKHDRNLRVKYSKDEVTRYPRPQELLNPKAAEFVLLDTEYRKYYVLYDKYSMMILDSVYGDWLGRFNFDDEGLSSNELSIIKFALKRGYVPVYPKKNWYSRRVRIDKRYFLVDSKETSPKLKEIYTEILNHFNPEANGHIFDFRVLDNNNRVLDVGVSGNSKTDKLVLIDPNYGDWTNVQTLESIGFDGKEKSIISYLESIELEIIYPMN